MNTTTKSFQAPTLDQLDPIREILTSNGRTLVQGELAWIWGRSEKTIPIRDSRQWRKWKKLIYYWEGKITCVMLRSAATKHLYHAM